MSFADSTSAIKLLPKKEAKKEKPTGGVKLKKSLAKKTKPKDTESNGILNQPSSITTSNPDTHRPRCRNYYRRRDP